MSALGELFLFKEADLTFAQTSGTQAVIYNGEAYEPWPIGHSNVESKNDLSKQKLDITMSLDNPLVKRYFAKPIDNVVTVDVYQQDDNGVSIMWKGRLTSTRQTANREVALSFESIFTSLRRPGLRARYQKMCRAALYGRGCNLNPEDWAFETTVVSMVGNQVTVGDLSGFAAGRFRGGMIRSPDSTLRFIMDQSGNTLVLSRPFLSLQDILASDGYGESYGQYYGQATVKIYPGCAHNLDGCESFDNVLNYRGFPWIPTRNPFQTSVT